MSSPQTWHFLPADLAELQIGQIDLLIAMYPDDVTLDDHAQKLLDSLRDGVNDVADITSTNPPTIPLTLDIPVSAVKNETSQTELMRLDLMFAFGYIGSQPPQDPPETKIRIQQAPWMSKAATTKIISQIPAGEDLNGIIEYIGDSASQALELSSKQPLSTLSQAVSADCADLFRVWFYFPSISTRSKRDDFIKHAPAYGLTGFLYAGKPGLLCVEGKSQSIDDYMKFIKTESWSDIPAHHKKVSERYRSSCDTRVFADMTEITDMVGERRGQRANRGDMKAVEEWLVGRGLGDAFAKVLM